jgi:hypothetical protein
MANPGDTWILPIAELQGGGWIEHAGAGYGGASAWEGNGWDGTRRALWKTDNTTMPTTTELYTIEYFVPLSGPNNWQPIESIISGSAGEVYPNDSNIPWAGMWGTNHQYIGAYDAGPAGTWKATGAGPHTPDSADYNAGPGGIYMWLHRGSWMYVKWDYGWAIDNTVSAIRLTQITPEPGSLLLLLLAAPMLLRRRGQ